jgi:ABC-2 type transport system ATP-binding protein
MNEMAVTADFLIVIGRGKLITQSTTDEVIARSTDKSVRVRTPDPARLTEMITAAGGTATPGGPARPGDPPSANGAELLTVTGLDAARVGEIAASGSVVLHELTPMASLEEAFMELTSGSVEFGQHSPDPVNAAEGSAR